LEQAQEQVWEGELVQESVLETEALQEPTSGE
jgi:hypothetical protein